MTPIAILFMGAACGYLAGNPVGRQATFKQVGKLFGMAIDGLNKQGGQNAPTPTTDEPEQPET